MSDNRRKAVVIFSGGMDSAAMLRMTQFSTNDVYALTFDYGQRHKREIECAKTQIEHATILGFNHSFEDTQIFHKVIDVSFLKELAPTSSLTNDNIDNPDVKDMVGEAQPVSYVPFRNQLFLSIACSYAEAVGAGQVVYGATEVDSLAGYWDASPEFKSRYQDLISLNRKNEIALMTPLLTYDKKAIVEYCANNNVSLANTYTCYSGDEIADATTPSSSLRIKGFADAGYIDPQPYKQDLTSFWEENNCKPYPDEPFLGMGGTRGLG